MTLFESVFAGNDAVYGLTEGAINQAIEKYGADKAVCWHWAAASATSSIFPSCGMTKCSSWPMPMSMVLTSAP